VTVLWWPVDAIRVTGEWANSPAYYAQYGQRGHNGLDLAMPLGTAVHAMDAGVIEFEGWGQNHNWMGAVAGIAVIVRHAWGYTGYAHLSSTNVNRGQSVARGQEIGKSGSTGGSTGPHLHMETFPAQPNFGNGFAGRINPRTFTIIARGGNPAAVESNQRKVGSIAANRRSGPTTGSGLKEPNLSANEIGTFNGWITGESLDGNAVWFRGISGDWFWSGSFTDKSTTGLKDLNPVVAPPTTPPVAGNVRVVDPGSPVRVRAGASSETGITRELAGGAKVAVEGYITNGQPVQNIAIWYKLADGWAWAGGFTVEDGSGLTNLTPTTPPVVVPPVVTPPVDPALDIGPGPVLGTVTGWQGVSAPEFSQAFSRPVSTGKILELKNVTEHTIGADSRGYNVGREGVPNHAVLHHTATNNAASARNTLSGANGAPTAQYLVEDRVAWGMVDERDTAATNGRWKSNTRGINLEIVNSGSPIGKPSPESHHTAAQLVARAARRWNWRLPLELGVNVFGHGDVSKSPTACPGELDKALIVRLANNALAEGVEVPPVVVPPVVVPPARDDSELTGALGALTALLNKILDFLKSIFKSG
jgi:hypothetical protein